MISFYWSALIHRTYFELLRLRQWQYKNITRPWLRVNGEWGVLVLASKASSAYPILYESQREV